MDMFAGMYQAASVDEFKYSKISSTVPRQVRCHHATRHGAATWDRSGAQVKPEDADVWLPSRIDGLANFRGDLPHDTGLGAANSANRTARTPSHGQPGSHHREKQRSV